MIAKDLFALNDAYIAANEFKLLTGKQVTLYAFNNSVSYRILKPITGYPTGGPTGYEEQAEETTAPGTITFPGASGIKLRNASVGLSPAPLASIRVYDRADVIGQGFTPISVIITAAGSVTIGQEVAYAEFTVPVTIVATTEATATTIVTAPAFTADGSTYLIEFFAPEVITPSSGATSVTAVLYEDGGSIGQMGLSVLAVNEAVTWLVARKRTPTSVSHTYSIRFFAGTASVSTVQAGAGGSGNKMPGYIRITKAT